MVNRKLVRPRLAEVKERFQPNRGGGAHEHSHRETSSTTGFRRRPAPPEQTNAEAFYYLKQMNNQTPMVVVLDNGDELRGHIEWYAGYHSLPLGGDMRLEDFRTRFPSVHALMFFHVRADATVTRQTLDWSLLEEPAVVRSIREALDALRSRILKTGAQVEANALDAAVVARRAARLDPVEALLPALRRLEDRPRRAARAAPAGSALRCATGQSWAAISSRPSSTTARPTDSTSCGTPKNGELTSFISLKLSETSRTIFSSRASIGVSRLCTVASSSMIVSLLADRSRTRWVRGLPRKNPWNRS